MPESDDDSRRFFYADVLKLKDFHLYKFLYDMPLFSRLISELSLYLSSQNDVTSLSLDNSSKTLKSAIKTTQMIHVWLKCLPIEHAESVIKFTQLNFILNSDGMNRDKKQLFFAQVCSIILENPLFPLLSDSLASLSQALHLDLSHESIDMVASNRFLCQKASSLLKATNLPLFLTFYLAPRSTSTLTRSTFGDINAVYSNK